MSRDPPPHRFHLVPERLKQFELPEGVTQADLDAATPLPPLGDSRRERVTHIITVTEPGYDVVLFFNEDGGAEAVITRPGLAPTGVNIAPPGPGRRIVVERIGDKFAVLYRDSLRTSHDSE